MIQKILRLISLTSMICVFINFTDSSIVSAKITTPTSEEQQTGTYNEFSYKILNDDTIEITAINNSKDLVNIIFPTTINGKKVTTIDCCLFGIAKGNNTITSIEIPSSITTIESNSFYECTNLSCINVNNDNPNYSSKDGILYDKNKTTLLSCPHNITSVSIPSTVTNIYNGAFYSCTNLEQVSIPKSVTDIHFYEFNSCKNLKNINVDKENQYYTSVNGCLYTKDKTKILFYTPSSTSLTIQDGLTKIDNNTFVNCRNLKSITIASSITDIEPDSFINCTDLQEIIVDQNNKEYSSENGVLFNKNKTTLIKHPQQLLKVYIPDSVEYIGQYAFYNCSSLKSIVLPNNLNYIGDYAFSNCSNLKSINFPYSLYSIDYASFENCTSLMCIKLPSSLETFDNYCFAGCTNLKSVTFLSNPSIMAFDGFKDDNNLTTIYGMTNSYLPDYCKQKNITFIPTDSINSTNTPISTSSPATSTTTTNSPYSEKTADTSNLLPILTMLLGSIGFYKFNKKHIK